MAPVTTTQLRPDLLCAKVVVLAEWRMAKLRMAALRRLQELKRLERRDGGAA